MRRGLAFGTTFCGTIGCLLLACGDPQTPPIATPSTSGGATGSGGSLGTGGSNLGTGGASAGGATGNGGSSVGGSLNGGSSNGGSSNGGSLNGGSLNGGSLNGGASIGGLTAAGSGGAGKGGMSNGGNAGSASGGKAAAGAGGSGGASGSTSAGGSAGASSLPKFSFFVTSVGAMKALSKSNDGFGGDLTYGETGDGAGLRGADKICTEIAEKSMPGSGAKIWRAFLSVPVGENGSPVNAKDRIGMGPWYDRLGRTLALTLADLMQLRPRGADPAIINDFPNEAGVPNHLDGAPGCTGNACPDNHDILTGSGTDGNLYMKGTNPTCSSWTSKVGSAGRPRCGHSWPRQGSQQHWASFLDEAGCAAGINLVEMGPPDLSDPTVGSGGGYGGIYCFALSP